MFSRSGLKATCCVPFADMGHGLLPCNQGTQEKNVKVCDPIFVLMWRILKMRSKKKKKYNILEDPDKAISGFPGSF